MQSNILRIVALVAILVLFGVAIYVYRPGQGRFTRVTVIGDSQAKVAPDTAVITFSVVTQGKEAVDAQQENARKSEAVRQAVDTVVSGTKAEVKTGDYDLEPQRDYSGQIPKIKGYDVRNTVIASIDQLDKVGAVIDAATKAGANSVDGIRYIVGPASPAQGDALSLATKQAMAKAESIARSLNGHIARVVETTEGGIPIREDQVLSENGSSNTSAFKPAARMVTTPIQAGSLDVHSQVILVVEIAF